MDTRQTIIGERRTYSDVGCSHDHTFAQLIVPLIGTLFIETEAHQLALDDSSVFFLPPRCQHYFYACDTNEFLILDIPADWVADWAGEPASHGIRTNFEERWRALRSLLLAELDGRSSTAMSSMGALLHLVHYIGSLLAQPCHSRSLAYIHQHYYHALDVAQLAHIEGYSLSYYSEWFKAHTGQSPTAYIQDLRLKRAKDLLQHTDLPIYHIARQVGFEQASSLTRLFQQRDRTTPKRYRANIQHLAN